jgi:hypothetical protein
MDTLVKIEKMSSISMCWDRFQRWEIHHLGGGARDHLPGIEVPTDAPWCPFLGRVCQPIWPGMMNQGLPGRVRLWPSIPNGDRQREGRVGGYLADSSHRMRSPRSPSMTMSSAMVLMPASLPLPPRM